MTAYPPCLSQHVHINQVAQGNTYNPPSCNHARREEVHTPCTDTEESDYNCSSRSSSSHHCYSSSKKTSTTTRCTCGGYAHPLRRSYRVKDRKHHDCECESSEEEHSHTHHSCSCSTDKNIEKYHKHHYHRHSRHTRRHTHQHQNRNTSPSCAGYALKGKALDFECACESCSESSSSSSSSSRESSCCSESYTHRHAQESHHDVGYVRHGPAARKNVRRGVARRGKCTCEEEEMHCAYGPPLMVVDVGRGWECCSHH